MQSFIKPAKAQKNMEDSGEPKPVFLHRNFLRLGNPCASIHKSGVGPPEVAYPSDENKQHTHNSFMQNYSFARMSHEESPRFAPQSLSY